MKNINRIITEVINNTIIFNELQSDATDLEYYVGSLKKEQAPNAEIEDFYKRFITFIEELIYALNRCVKAKSLNEGLTNNTPSLSNLYHSMVRGMNYDLLGSLSKGNNKKLGKTFGLGQTNGTNGESDVEITNGNTNTLYSLLTEEYPKINQEFFIINKKYNGYFFNAKNQAAKYVIDIIEEIIDTMKKAQGTNP